MDGVLAFLFALLMTLVVCALVVMLMAALALRAVRRRNRVSRESPTTAPVHWLASPLAGARLHRRLRTAVAVARSAAAAAPEASHLAAIVSDLEKEAVALDGHVVIASRLSGREGRERMAPLAEQVLRIEQMASQVSLLAAQAQAPMTTPEQGSALDDLARQLDTLEEARQEVAAVERTAGIERVSPYAEPARPRPAGEAQPGS